MRLRKSIPPIDRATVSAQLEDVSALLGHSYVSYHPVLAGMTGSVKAALYLSQAISWSRHVHKTQPERNGWYWLTAQECQSGTGLSSREQATAREILLNLGILQERRVGVPAKMWFRLNLDHLAGLVTEQQGNPPTLWSWDRSAMLRLLGQPIPCHRILIQVAGSVVGGLLLSYLFLATRRELVSGGQGDWLHAPIAETRAELGITAKQQRLARDVLRDAGYVEETYESAVQPRLFTRLNMGLLALECRKKANEIHCLQNPAILFAGSCKQELPKAQNWSGPNRITGVAQSANLDSTKGPLPIKKENYKEPLLPVQECAPQLPRGLLGSSSGESLSETPGVILPANLQDAVRIQAIRWLDVAPASKRQLVADEWAGLLRQSERGLRQVINPLGLLVALVRRASGQDAANPFVPTIAYQVAALRDRQHQTPSPSTSPEPRWQKPEGLNLRTVLARLQGHGNG